MTKIKIHAGCGNLGLNAISSAALLLAGVALAGTLNAKPVQQYNVLVADSQATIYSVNPRTGERAIVTQGDKLNMPYDLALNREGTIVVSDSAGRRILYVNPVTGEQTILAQGLQLGLPLGIDVDKHDRIYVANTEAVLSVNPRNGKVETVATGGLLRVPLDVAVASDGSLYVADAVAGIVRVDPTTHKQILIATGEFLHRPAGIALDGDHSAYVADSTGQCVVRVDLVAGVQQLMSMAGLLTTPVGIAMAPGGTLLVSDPDAFEWDGGIMTINTDGTQKAITRGYGDLVNSRGIAIQPLTSVHELIER